ncbi:vegetative cell wall protein gp1-like isoform X5 [Gallus gallus]|uniref:vegetative cell wall protein gp1-like isoform X5 n=1 Tax=Gallus gallus TaxID=9031 RepID=UPI001AE8FC1E|nr:vegetative cell wall protein gp1-like isoform X5 [Gallus gallus]
MRRQEAKAGNQQVCAPQGALSVSPRSPQRPQAAGRSSWAAAAGTPSSSSRCSSMGPAVPPPSGPSPRSPRPPGTSWSCPSPSAVQDLQRELDAVTHRLEQLRAQRPPAAPPPTPPLALPHRDTAALLTAFEATELRGPRGGRDPQLCPIGSAAPNACTALRHLGKHMEALRRLQAAAEAALRMEGERKEWESRMEALQQCHRLPPT